MLKRVLRSTAVQAVTARLVGAYLYAALRSTRWTVVGAEHLYRYVEGDPAIAACWHECLPLAPMAWLMLRRRGAVGEPQVLVSKHRDGRFIGTVMRRFGVRVVHGSTSKYGTARDVTEKGGPASMRVLLAGLEAGQHVILTPDGPRGPRRCAAPGVAQLGGLSGNCILPIGVQTSHRRVLPTWDRMIVPLPFGRAVLVCGAPIAVPREGWEASLPAIEAALTEAIETADRLCRA